HRKLIERDPNQIPLTARRATPNREFIASKDTWFRPVQFANAPDGNLYILDMYREVIEHPASLPPVLKKHLDLTSGRDRGRLYRIVHEKGPDRQRKPEMQKMPGDATTVELVAMLAHSNGWHRTTAARLLYERNDQSAVAELKRLCGSTQVSEGEILALYLLSHFDELDSRIHWNSFLEDAYTREHAVRLAARQLARPEARGDLGYRLNFLASDPDLRVRYQVAFALGESTDSGRFDALATIIRRDADKPYLCAAVLSSVARGSTWLLRELIADADFRRSAPGREFLIELARQIGARGDSAELASVARDLTKLQQADKSAKEGEAPVKSRTANQASARQEPRPPDDLAAELLVAAVRGAGSKQQQVREQFAAATGGATNKVLDALVEQSLETAAADSAKPAARVAAIAALPLGEFAAAEPVLTELLAPRHPQNVQLAALAAFGQFGNADVAPSILAAWPGMSPTLRARAAELLMSRTASAMAMLDAVEQGAVAPRDLDPATIQRLKTHADAAIRERAATLLDVAAPKRTEVVQAHADVLQFTGNADHGREVFRKNCAICHRKDGHGAEVGADLATVVTRTPEQLLISILDPNREVDPKYLQYTILTVDGLAKSGMIAAETAASVTLKREENVTETIPRADIDQLQSTGMTLMPEGFEKAIDKQSLADLIAYLRNDDKQ
ncbi:MAG TPA: c-type cytochrome, partial [Lacipirellula sp.]